MRRLAALILVLWAGGAMAQDSLRLATFNASLSREGAGLLIEELGAGGTVQTARIAAIIQTVRPDILLINEIDHDPEGRALAAFLAYLREGRLGAEGIDYPHSFIAPSNTGVPSGVDLDGNGEIGGPGDAFGFGLFPGQFAMALVSRYPIDHAGARSFQTFLWKDLPGGIPPVDFAGWHPEVMRLSSKSHWDVPVQTPGGPLHILASHPTPPVFDGPEDRNGRRNHDELRFWTLYLSGAAFRDDQGRLASGPEAPVAVMGDLNVDPFDGDARGAAIRALIALDRLTDPAPMSRGAVQAAQAQGGFNTGHVGPHATDTSDWNDRRGPGNLRADYVLTDRRLVVTGSGVFWPAPGEEGHDLLGPQSNRASDHHLVWVDVSQP